MANLTDFSVKTARHEIKEQHFLCEKCAADFTDEKHLNRHMIENHPDYEDLICKDCYKSFDLEELYKEHIKVHLPYFFCSICNKGFRNHNDLKHHEKQHQKLHKCSKCMIVSYSEEFILKHMKKHDKAKIRKELLDKEKEEKKKTAKPCTYTCKFCKGKTIYTYREYMVHLDQNHKDEQKNHMCKTCNVTFDGATNLIKHLKLHDKFKFVCTICEKGFSGSLYLKDHMWVHDGVKRHECGECGQKFTTNGSLVVHKRIHSGEYVVKCDGCERKFICRSSYNKHVCATHGEKKFYKCKKCHKSFASMKTLRGHMNNHLGIKPYECQICDKKYSIKQSFDVHMRVHNGTLFKERKFNCEVCDKSYNERYTLERHKLSHTDRRPYKCEDCSQWFKSYEGLRLHRLNIHSNYRPYVCSVCHKGYLLKTQIKKHMQTHYKHGTVNCDMCNRVFKNENALKQHKKDHRYSKKAHVKNFYCFMCGKGFSSMKVLSGHTKIEHQDIYCGKP